MLKKCLKISGLVSLLSFGLFWLYDGTELADTFGIILIVAGAGAMLRVAFALTVGEAGL